MGIINDKIKQLIQGHEELITRENEPVKGGNGIFTRYKYPVLTAAHTPISGVTIWMKTVILI